MSFQAFHGNDKTKTDLYSWNDLDGNEVSIEADELEARLFQHEMDHLDGVLLLII